MRSLGLVCLLLVGALLSEANAQHRRYVNDRDSENQIDSTGTPVEEPERHHHHRHHRHHYGRHHRGFQPRSGANLSQAEETIEFHRYFMRSVRSLAEQSGLCNDDVNTLLNIIEENRPPFKKEDRSQWTEEQWQMSKEERKQRKELVRKQAFEQIQDQVHLTIFFDRLEAQKKLMKENIHKYIVARLTRIAVRSGLNDSQIEKFIRELETHKPVGVHWRPGMSQNEKKKNIEIHVKNWQQIKEACLRDASEAEQMQFNRFFVAVEQDFARSMHGEHRGERHHGRHHHHRHHHRRHHDEEDLPRESLRGRRRHFDDETETVDSEGRRPHRHHRRHNNVDEDVEDRPRRHHHRRHHHETEEEDRAPMRRRSDEVDDSEEHRYRRPHHLHRRPHHVADSDESEERSEDVPEHHRRRHHHRRQHRHQEVGSDSSEERRDEEFEPRRPHHHHRHHRNRHPDTEEIDDSKARPEPYRHYRRHVRPQDSAEE